MSLKNSKIIVGITGGIAAYKIPTLIRLLKKDGAEVHAVMTESATKFITELTIETVSQFPVAIKMFPENRFAGTHHIDYAEWPDMIIIAPATANFIGKIASGISDDLLTTIVCASKKPILIAPAMNSNMYLNQITQKNIGYLKSLGYHFIDPDTGDLACETSGIGRMREPEEIFRFIKNFRGESSKKKVLKNKTVIVTAGPCREPIDPVRFISNRSSGKMGFALARAAYEAGARVILISGPSSLSSDFPATLVRVETTEEMYTAVVRYLPASDILIMAAAPADFKAKNIEPVKIKKMKIAGHLEISKTIDILAALKKQKKTGQKIIGFALESEPGIINARKKLREKDLDMIVLNSMESGSPFDSDSNTVTLIFRDGRQESPDRMEKNILARLIINKIAEMK